MITGKEVGILRFWLLSLGFLGRSRSLGVSTLPFSTLRTFDGEAVKALPIFGGRKESPAFFDSCA